MHIKYLMGREYKILNDFWINLDFKLRFKVVQNLTTNLLSTLIIYENTIKLCFNKKKICFQIVLCVCEGYLLLVKRALIIIKCS